MSETILYRFEDSLYGEIPTIQRLDIPVERETEHVWFIYGGTKRVYKNSRASYAYPTIELAKHSYEIRKRKQEGYLQAQLAHVQAIRALMLEQPDWADSKMVQLYNQKGLNW